MTGERHPPPYPTGTGDSDPRPYWHRDLADRVDKLEDEGTRTELALLSHRLATMEAETRLLRRSVLAAAPVVAGVAAVVTRFVT